MDIDTLEEIHRNFADDEKKLHKALNLEIRFRKFTLTEVKSSCPLFRQKGLTSEEKLRNLSTLITSQLEFRALADMEDLEEAISKADDDQMTDGSASVACAIEEQSEVNSNVVKEKEVLVLDDGISICPNEFIIAMFEDGPYPGEIISFDDTNVTINFLESATINKQRSFKYWKWPTIIDQHTVNKLSILPIRPSLDIATQYSNNRNVVFELLNFDLVMKFEWLVVRAYI